MSTTINIHSGQRKEGEKRDSEIGVLVNSKKTYEFVGFLLGSAGVGAGELPDLHKNRKIRLDRYTNPKETFLQFRGNRRSSGRGTTTAARLFPVLQVRGRCFS